MLSGNIKRSVFGNIAYFVVLFDFQNLFAFCVKFLNDFTFKRFFFVKKGLKFCLIFDKVRNFVDFGCFLPESLLILFSEEEEEPEPVPTTPAPKARKGKKEL